MGIWKLISVAICPRAAIVPQRKQKRVKRSFPTTLSILFPKTQRFNMFPPRCPISACKNREVYIVVKELKGSLTIP
jgi:hypothetical protein